MSQILREDSAFKDKLSFQEHFILCEHKLLRARSVVHRRRIWYDIVYSNQWTNGDIYIIQLLFEASWISYLGSALKWILRFSESKYSRHILFLLLNTGLSF